jgi:hypothetical protein
MDGNAPPQARNTRDLRIDFFRGVALYMIIFDHVPGDPLSKFTYARFGFSDAAEIFIFLSGVSCGIVYSRVLLRHGPRELLNAVFRRALQIYIYYLIAGVTTILLIAVSRDIITIPLDHQAYIVLREDPLTAIRSAIFLVSPPELPGILLIYIELTLLVIPSFLFIATVSKKLALITSGVIWCLSQAYPDFLHHLPAESYFKFLAWQFLFCIGMYVGIVYNTDAPLLANFKTRNWMMLAWIVIWVGFIYKFVLAHFARLNINVDVLTISDQTLQHMKENLSAIRLLHFLSVAFLVATYVKTTNLVLSWPGASAIIKSGRCSLQVFCLGAVLSVLLNEFVAVEEPVVFARLIVDCVSIFLIASVATVLMKSRLDYSLHAARPAA